jgi:peptide/nickel transport system substrate-binding protein
MIKLAKTGLVAVAILALAACTGKAPAHQAGPANQTFTYLNNLDVMTEWDPATSYSNEIIAMNNMYEQLTRSDPQTHQVGPLLATSWQQADHGKTWTFQLRKGVTFTTGRPVTAAAAKAAIERTISLKGGAAYIWDPVKTIDATGPTTLVFHLKYAAPLDLIASSAYAAFIYDTKAAGSGNLGKWFEQGHAAGTGPYQVGSWDKGTENELQLTKNPHYWGGWSGSHYTSIDFKVVPEETTAVQLLQSGQGSFIPQLSSSLFSSLKGQSGVTTERSPSFENVLAMLNTASGPLANPQVRRAVADAIDYNGIVKALGGAMTKSTGVVPPGLLGYTTSIQPTTNSAQAKALLAAAGYSSSHQLTLSLTYAAGDPQLDTIVTLMKSNLAAVGVNLEAKALSWPTQWSIGKSADPSKRQDVFLFYWYPDYADPYSWFINLFHSASPPYFNMSYWDNPQADQMIDRLQALTATSRAKAQQQYVALQQLISQDAVSPMLGVVNSQRALASSVHGYVDNPAYNAVVFVHDLTPAAG